MSPSLGCCKCPAVEARQGTGGWKMLLKQWMCSLSSTTESWCHGPARFQTLPQSTICSSNTKAQRAVHRKQFPWPKQAAAFEGPFFLPLAALHSPEDVSCPQVTCRARSQAVLSSPLAVLPFQVEFVSPGRVLLGQLH